MANLESDHDTLAIHGGKPAKTKPSPPMFPGGMAIGEEEEQAVLEVIRSRRLFRYYGPEPGPSKVDELEQAFAAHLGVRYALAVTSGTAALMCGLQGAGVGPGDEVIIPAYTWIASASAVLAVGGVPVLAEVDGSLTLDPADVERKISPYTQAIMPVHMRGVPCRMDALLEVAHQHGVKVVEDVAQADGASYKGRRLGAWGDVGCFSLQFNKIITSGEGGMVSMDDETTWKRALQYHDVIGGIRNGFAAEEILWGVNFRMPELLAAVMLVQLRRLDGLLAAMRLRKQMLVSGIEPTLREKGILLQEIPDPQGDASVALIFFMDTPSLAGEVARALDAEAIEAFVIYEPERVDYHIYTHWGPVVNKRTWTAEGGPWRWAKRSPDYSPQACPRTLDLLGRAVHLNISPLLTNDDIEETIDGLRKVFTALA